MTDLFSASSYFFAALTVVVYALAAALQRKTRMVVLNPIMISAFAVIGFLARWIFRLRCTRRAARCCRIC